MCVPEQVDVAIVTVLPEEYKAVLKRLDHHWADGGAHDHPNLYAWELGEVVSPHHSKPYRVVVALAQQAGGTAAATVTAVTAQRWSPRYIMVVGVAGGLRHDELTKLERTLTAKEDATPQVNDLSEDPPEAGDSPDPNGNSLQKGDVVVSSAIWGYEYGKVERGFKPRPDLTYQVDRSLLSAAAVLDDAWTASVNDDVPAAMRKPHIRVGPIASGDKVVDDASDPFFLAVWRAWPELIAVEMEGAGAAQAIQILRDQGMKTGFIMIRGISDMPRVGEVPRPGGQTQERDTWKRYASATAAAVAIQLLRERWPVPPRASEHDPADEAETSEREDSAFETSSTSRKPLNHDDYSNDADAPERVGQARETFEATIDDRADKGGVDATANSTKKRSWAAVAALGGGIGAVVAVILFFATPHDLHWRWSIHAAVLGFSLVFAPILLFNPRRILYRFASLAVAGASVATGLPIASIVLKGYWIDLEVRADLLGSVPVQVALVALAGWALYLARQAENRQAPPATEPVARQLGDAGLGSLIILGIVALVVVAALVAIIALVVIATREPAAQPGRPPPGLITTDEINSFGRKLAGLDEKSKGLSRPLRAERDNLMRRHQNGERTESTDRLVKLLRALAWAYMYDHRSGENLRHAVVLADEACGHRVQSKPRVRCQALQACLQLGNVYEEAYSFGDSNIANRAAFSDAARIVAEAVAMTHESDGSCAKGIKRLEALLLRQEAWLREQKARPVASGSRWAQQDLERAVAVAISAVNASPKADGVARQVAAIASSCLDARLGPCSEVLSVAEAACRSIGKSDTIAMIACRTLADDRTWSDLRGQPAEAFCVQRQDAAMRCATLWGELLQAADGVAVQRPWLPLYESRQAACSLLSSLGDTEELMEELTREHLAQALPHVVLRVQRFLDSLNWVKERDCDR